jgi:hypothetical protein
MRIEFCHCWIDALANYFKNPNRWKWLNFYIITLPLTSRLDKRKDTRRWDKRETPTIFRLNSAMAGTWTWDLLALILYWIDALANYFKSTDWWKRLDFYIITTIDSKYIFYESDPIVTSYHNYFLLYTQKLLKFYLKKLLQIILILLHFYSTEIQIKWERLGNKCFGVVHSNQGRFK